MQKSMLLLEVRDRNGQLFKRRISENYYAIEEWLENNAQKWVLLPVVVDCDYYGNGAIRLTNNADSIVYEFRTSNIAII